MESTSANSETDAATNTNTNTPPAAAAMDTRYEDVAASNNMTESMNAPDNSSVANEDTQRDEDDEDDPMNPVPQQPSKEKLDTTSATAIAATEPITLGGTLEKPCFCVLDGVFSPKEGDGKKQQQPQQRRRCTFPICHLPAVLGRSHSSKDHHFISMGKDNTLSRTHMQIDYRIKQGKLLQVKSNSNKFTFHQEDENNDDADNDHQRNKDGSVKGYYTITCLGKNRITVNGRRVELGETAILKPRSTVRVSHYCLYFLLPVTPSTETMQVTTTTKKTDASTKKRKSISGAPPNIATTKMSAATTANKRPKSTTSSSQNHGPVPGGWPTLQAELDETSTEDLLHQMGEAIAAGNWDRRHQSIGSTLSYRAVLDAAKDTRLQAVGEISRSELMDWIASHDKYKVWVEQMLSKMEAKSYQASITKAMIKANFTRTASTGRYIKWIFPAEFVKHTSQHAPIKQQQQQQDANEKVSQKTDREEEDEEEEEEDGEGDQDDSNKGTNAGSGQDESEEENDDESQEGHTEEQEEGDDEEGPEGENSKQSESVQMQKRE